jgi:phosphoribosylaminoimidazolecarboxamide formyltransferase/IMP cyclohydrolase
VIERALFSVHDKTGLEPFAHGLSELGVELVASGGTAAFLSEHGLDVTRVEELTGVPELLGGRVKTLHPRIHAAILARRDQEDDRAALDEHEIRPFDLVCVNLYPFSEAVARHGVREEQAVEMIDVGGPAMLRAAAKNFAHVAPVCRPQRYEAVLSELRENDGLSVATRRSLAAEAFATTAAYEAVIAAWFADREAFPESFIPAFTKMVELPYGENPHQRAAYYAEAGARRHLLSRVTQLHGRELSFNNLSDLSAARLVEREFTLPCAVIVKHANPCGVAAAGSIEQAYERALAADPLSAYGGIVVLNRTVEDKLAERLAQQFVEVLFAPGYSEEALATLTQKPGIRILENKERRLANPGERDYRRVLGGLLVQDRDWEIDDREGMEVVCGSPTEMAWGDLLFSWRVCKHVASNAIVIAHDLQTIGIGAGQMSRVDAVRIALEKAREHGHDVEGAALASDAFFPFADGPELALRSGVRAFIQPGGSKRDAEVIEAVERAGGTMVFTHRRHFRH